MTAQNDQAYELDADGPPEGDALERDQDELYRQCFPDWFEAEVPSALNFRPAWPRDRKRLSTAWSAKVSAEQAARAHEARGNETVGSWAVSVAEARIAGVPAWADGGLMDLPEEHVSLYFGEKSKKAASTISKLLRADAVSRGCRYRTGTQPRPADTAA